MKKIIFKIVIFLVFSGFLLVSLPITVGWVLTHPPNVPILKRPASGIAYKPVSFPSRQPGVTLKGWFIPAENSNKTIIIAHGYFNNRTQSDVPALDLAQVLQKNGYNVLMFDFSNCGESDGKITSFGQFEKEDLKGAVDYAKSLKKQGEHIGIIGFSMGAATTIIAAAEDSRVEAIVVDSPFADLRPYLEENLSVWTRIPSKQFNGLILKVLPDMVNLQPEQVSPLKAVEQINIPVLFIHGIDDRHIPASNSKTLYERSPEGKSLWLVPKAGHLGSYKIQPKEYAEHILALFKQMPSR